MAKRVLITGATGFLGGALSKHMHALGYQIVGLGRDHGKIEQLKQGGIEAYAIDLSEKAVLSVLKQDFDCIVHCAAKSSPWGTQHDFIAQNVDATRHVFEFALSRSITRIVHISTPSIYFEFKDKFNVKEDDPLPKKMVNLYAQTKLAAEHVVQEYIQKGINSIIIRPRAIIGAGDTVIFPRIIKAYQQGRLKQMGSSNPLMDVTNIDNLVHAIVLSVEAGENAYNKTYNISNGDPIKFWDLVGQTLNMLEYPFSLKAIPYPIAYSAAALSEWIALFTGKEPTLTKYGIGIIRYGLTMNIENAQKHLNYKPKSTSLEAVTGFVNWWKNKKHV